MGANAGASNGPCSAIVPLGGRRERQKATAAKGLLCPNGIFIHESAKHLLIPLMSAAENETLSWE